MTAAGLADREEPPGPAVTATASELSAVCIRLAVVTVEHPADTADHLELVAQAAMLIGDLISRLSARLPVMDCGCGYDDCSACSDCGWACLRCGAAYFGPVPDDGLCPACRVAGQRPAPPRRARKAATS
jgi:hypothetical protein